MPGDTSDAATLKLSKCGTRPKILHLQDVSGSKELAPMRFDPRECCRLMTRIQHLFHEIIHKWRVNAMPPAAGRLPEVSKIFSRDGDAAIQTWAKLGYRSQTSKL